MKLLILAANYPDLNGNIPLYYIHTRSIYYHDQGIDVTVLNFSAKENYTIDNIKVITLASFKKEENYNYDLLILHAANLRNHYLFLKKYGDKFKKHLFFFHGHEVLMVNKVYSEPYSYVKSKKTKIFRDIYDTVKLKIWNKYFNKHLDKSYFIFVSNWMKDEFLKWTRIDYNLIKNHSYITYNSIGETFVNSNYEIDSPKEYDFVTIRSNIDGSKYCIDLVNNLAFANPKHKFLLIGKGNYFKYNEKADNLEFIEKNLNHKEIIEILNKSRCALMPTRTDAQGLMACEIATFGIPLITSDIDVCHEIFDDFENVKLIKNENTNLKLNKMLNSFNKIPYKKNKKYFQKNTCGKEIEIISKIIGE